MREAQIRRLAVQAGLGKKRDPISKRTKAKKGWGQEWLEWYSPS
jgi:hypothetical protein